MPTISVESGPLTVREGQDRISLTLTVDRDYTGTPLVVYLTDRRGTVHEIGQAPGVGDGQTVTIPVVFDVPPDRTYTVEIGPQDRSLPAAWPREGEEGRVTVRPVGYD